MRHIKVFFQNFKLGYLWSSVVLKAPPLLSIDGCLKVRTNNDLGTRKKPSNTNDCQTIFLHI